ncbi:DUF2809 domain-containing protein [Sphingomonas sp.]|uniref:ribosomal maturation YjgA family protein n=1 Tax=Sphingomonas sp. TaxID=28214 RepID=UPI003CC64042
MRRGYAAAAGMLLLVEIAIALWVDDRFVRPHGGDALAVVLVYCGLMAATRWRWPVAVGVALLIAVVIELGQLIGVLRLVGLDGVAVARVVLGSGYDPRDFVAYAVGGLTVVLFETWRNRRAGDGSPPARG